MKKKGTEEKASEDKKTEDYSKDIQKRLDKLTKELNDKYGESGNPVVFTGEEEGGIYTTSCIPTGLMNVDECSGMGGLPDNAICEFFGPEGSGKSFIAQCAIIGAQKTKPDKVAWYIDLEGGIERERMRALGMDLNKLRLLDNTISGEEMFDMIFKIVESEVASVIVIDSVAAIRCVAHEDMSMVEIGKQVSPIGRLMSNGLKRLASLVKRHRCLIIFINQLRMKIGTMGFGNPEDTPGGRALKFFAQVRGDVRPIFDKTGKIKKEIMNLDDKQIGQRSRVRFIKNKFAPPQGEGMFEIYFQKPDIVAEVLEKSKKAKLWSVRSEVWTYKLPDGDKITATSQKEFFDALIVGGFVIQMAERILEMQRNGELTENLLADDFDIEALEKAIFENEENQEVSE